MIASLAQRWSARFDAGVDVAHLAWLRIALGVITLIHLEPFARRALRGRTYLDTFHLPYIAGLPELPEPAYIAALFIGVMCAALLTIGLGTRVTGVGAAAIVGYNLFVTQTHYSNNRAFLLILLIGTAALPVGGARSVDAWVARRRGRPVVTAGRAWVVDLLRLEVAVVYLASGISKLLDPDWWGGAVLRIRIERGLDGAVAVGVPRALLDALADPSVMWWGAKAVVLTELFIGLGLWSRRTRPAAVALAIVFHLSIQVTADVEVFTWAALAALWLWVPAPAIGDDVAGWGRVGPARLASATLPWSAR